MNSFRRVVRGGIHQPFDLRDGRDRVPVASIAAVSVEKAKETHWSSLLGEGVTGGEG